LQRAIIDLADALRKEVPGLTEEQALRIAEEEAARQGWTGDECTAKDVLAASVKSIKDLALDVFKHFRL
jgi:hypothetical protein